MYPVSRKTEVPPEIPPSKIALADLSPPPSSDHFNIHVLHVACLIVAMLMGAVIAYSGHPFGALFLIPIVVTVGRWGRISLLFQCTNNEIEKAKLAPDKDGVMVELIRTAGKVGEAFANRRKDSDPQPKVLNSNDDFPKPHNLN